MEVLLNIGRALMVLGQIGVSFLIMAVMCVAIILGMTILSSFLVSVIT